MTEQEDAASQNQRARILRAGTLHWFHWAVIVGSLVLTFGAWLYAQRQVDQKVATQFDREASQVVELITERLQKYEDALWGGVGAIQSHGGRMDHEQWRMFSETLHLETKYPGINGIGLVEYVAPEDLPAYVARERQSRNDFAVRPQHDENEYLPITYVEPVATNRQAVGLDMAHEANRYQAARKARESGVAQITGPIILVQDAEQTPGFLFYAPFYSEDSGSGVEQREASFLGMVYAPFVVKKLMAGVLHADRRHVSLRIRDGGDILYDEAVPGEASDVPFQTTSLVELYGRSWEFLIRGDETFVAAAHSNQPLLILFGGIAIDGLLLCLFLFLSRANRRAVRYADAANAELRGKSDALAESNRHLEQFAYVASHDLRAPLRGIDSLSSWIEEDLSDAVNLEMKEQFGLLRGRVARMDTLLTSLLDFARAGRIEAKPKLVRLDTMLDEIEDLIELPPSFVIKRSGTVMPFNTVEVALEQVLTNLIGNAIKHHDADEGVIEIRLSDGDSWIEIEVADDGPGIPDALHDDAFKMFKTLRRRDEVEGSGIGLAMVRRFVTHAGGTVSIHANGDKGTAVRFSWPKVWPDAPDTVDRDEQEELVA